MSARGREAREGGEWRLNLRQERSRRILDAQEQPRRRGRFHFVPQRRHRVALDAETHREYEEEDYELSLRETGTRAVLDDYRVGLRSDRYDAGGIVNRRALTRQDAKRFNAWGGLNRPADRYAGNREHHERARDVARDARAELAAIRERRARIKAILTYGETVRR